MTPDGLVIQSSAHDVGETMDRLVAAVLGRGMLVFARIDHGRGAMDAGLELRPTELLVFGQAEGGTPLMQAAQTAGIDLPLKVLCWKDETGVVRLGFNAPSWIAHRHGIEITAASSIRGFTEMLKSVSREVCAL